MDEPATAILSGSPATAGGLKPDNNKCARADGSDKAEEPTAMMLVQHSTPGVVMGTVGHMSPEQAEANLSTSVPTPFLSAACCMKQPMHASRIDSRYYTRPLRSPI